MNTSSTVSPSVTKTSLKNYSKFLIPVFFTLTSFIGASLLFIVEPLIAKLLLPEFGGASSVWTTSTFFFQVLMLVGYLYVHASTKIGARKQPIIQIAIMLLTLLFLPIALPAMDTIPAQEPFVRLLLTLAIAIGVPFAVISTTGPLIQKWYSWTNSPRADDPYFLYAASNTGSFVGLLSYPFLIEPFTTLQQQKTLWSIAFSVFLFMVAICAIIVMTQNKKAVIETGGKAVEKVVESVEKIHALRYLWWILLAFIPASLQLGVTTYLTTDIASFPLLWIIPLTIYLITMIIAFARKTHNPPKKTVIVAFVLSLIALTVFLFPQVYGGSFNRVIAAFIILLGAFAVISYASHAALAADRPSTSHLTVYFVLISLGGALGGLFNSLIAPFVFVIPLELPIVLGLTILLFISFKPEKTTLFSIISIVILAIVLLSGSVSRDATLVASGRTFYGAWQVHQYSNSRVFTHGTTVHGVQLSDPSKKNSPTAYYSEKGPLGDVIEHSEKTNSTIIGLGVGTIAAYGETGDTMRFVEIDPSVVEVAENPELFTFLSDSKAETESVVGDGRLVIQDFDNNTEDLIVLDAFSSDSIPVHLLTVEAFEEYDEKLVDDGVIAVHVSNRIFDLAPVLVNNGNELGYEVLIKQEGENKGNEASATWVVLSKDAEKIADFEKDDWINITDYEEPLVWTDDHSSVLETVRR